MSPWRAACAAVVLVVFGPAAVVPAAAAQLALAWSDNSPDEDGFVVERRSATAASFATVATLGPGAAGFIDSGVVGGQAYCYRVHAFNAAGVSAPTNEACGTATATQALPLAVTLNSQSFSRADTMVATVRGTAGVVPTGIDAYVVVQGPGGVLLSLQLNGRLVPGLVPIARNLVMPTVTAPFAFPLAGAAPGSYTWLAAVTTPGTLQLVSPLASTPFTIRP